MAKGDSIGQPETRSLARTLRAYADELQAEPSEAFDLKMAAEPMEHPARLATKLARSEEVPLHLKQRS